jgi:regulator of RNase E activity RraA
MSPAQVNKPKSAKFIPGPGFRIKLSFERLDAQFIKEFAVFDSPDVSDQLNRLYALSPAIHCLTDVDAKLVGPACTVKVRPGDNLMVHKSLDVAQPGDVVVIDAGASPLNAALGNLICAKAQHRGIAGFVIDGYVRDLIKIKQVGLPVFARGSTPIGPLHSGLGEINYPICCGGVVVNPGDIVVADGSGVAMIPRDSAENVLERLRAFAAKNIKYFAAIRRGDFSNKWVDDLLNETGCIITP